MSRMVQGKMVGGRVEVVMVGSTRWPRSPAPGFSLNYFRLDKVKIPSTNRYFPDKGGHLHSVIAKSTHTIHYFTYKISAQFLFKNCSFFRTIHGKMCAIFNKKTSNSI